MMKHGHIAPRSHTDKRKWVRIIPFEMKVSQSNELNESIRLKEKPIDTRHFLCSVSTGVCGPLKQYLQFENFEIVIK